MSNEIYTVSVPTETADRLRAVAEHQGLGLDAVLAAAISDYIQTWEEHIADMADEGHEELPWLRTATE